MGWGVVILGNKPYWNEPNWTLVIFGYLVVFWEGVGRVRGEGVRGVGLSCL